MNDDHPAQLELLKSEHRRLDAEIEAMIAAGNVDQLELARMKKRKLHLNDQIQLLRDTAVPDIIA